MNPSITALSPVRTLTEYILNEFSVDGAHMLVMGYGENSYFGFGKYRGELDINFLGYRNFVSQIEDKISERPEYLSFLCLTSYVGALPPEDGKILRFADLREPKRRYGWLLNESVVRPLSASSLKSMVPKERKVKLSSSSTPRSLRF